MSIIYKLSTDISQFKQIALDAEQIASQLNAEGRVMDFVYMGVKDKRLLDAWGTVLTAFSSSPVYPHTVKLPSISVWVGTCLIFSEKAHAIFRLMLADYGEFLPINVSGFTYYIFNNLTDVEPDLTKSYYSDLETETIRSIEFGEGANDKLLFRSQWEGCSVCFCSQDFKRLFEEYGLTGLTFDSNLMSTGYLK